MKTPTNQPTPDQILEASGAVQRARGLMHLLAVAYNAKDDRNGPPSQEESDGILWLADVVGEELERTARLVADAVEEMENRLAPETATPPLVNPLTNGRPGRKGAQS